MSSWGRGGALGAQEQARAQPASWVLGGQPGAVIAFVPITKAQPGLQPLPHTLGSQTGHICPRQLQALSPTPPGTQCLRFLGSPRPSLNRGLKLSPGLGHGRGVLVGSVSLPVDAAQPRLLQEAFSDCSSSEPPLPPLSQYYIVSSAPEWEGSSLDFTEV